MERTTPLPFDDNPDHRMPDRFGRYRVLNLIGQGTWGPVFRARDMEHHVAAVIKTFAGDWTPDDIWRLSEELVSLVALPRPHEAVAALFGAGRQDDIAFLAMQAESRHTLDVAMASIAPAPVDRALTLIDALAQAIDAAWRQGLGHGALHPRDIFVTAEGELIRITGFGVSQAMERARLAVPARRVYTAPERSSGVWGIQADVFSLGAIAHELLTGRRPIGPGEQDGELGTEVPARQRAQIRRVLASALAVRPEQRFGSARAFAGALAETAGFRLDSVHGLGVNDGLPMVAASGSVAEVAARESVALAVSPPPAGATGSIATTLDEFAHVSMRAEPGSDLAKPAEHAAQPPASSVKPSKMPVLVTVLIGLVLGGGAVFAVLRPKTVQLQAPPPEAPVATPAREPVPANPAAANPAPPSPVTPTPAPVEPAPAPPPVVETVKRPEPRRSTPPKVPAEQPVATIVPIVPSRIRDSAASDSAPPAAAPGAAFGAIDVDSRPRGARVIVDGRFVGTAPLRLPEMSPGAHTIVLEAEGRPAVTRRVQVEAGQTTRVRLDLD